MGTKIVYKQWVLVALELPTVFAERLRYPLKTLIKFLDLSKTIENEFYKILIGEYLNNEDLFTITLMQYCASELFEEFIHYFDLVSNEIIRHLKKEMDGYSILSAEIIAPYTFLIQGAGFTYESF